MTTSSMAMGAAQACGCGCASSDKVCCTLDCLVRPRFFCGQLLTDQDLNALLTWTQDKLRLTRYRHGWGVVCGLEVRCDHQQTGATQHADTIVVGPGYAVSCCGDDIIVCNDTRLSLADACQDVADPCSTLRQPAKAVSQPEMLEVGTHRLPADEVRIVDLFISYKETQTNPQTALARGSCTQAAPCEYSRTNESFVLSWQAGMRDVDPVAIAAQRWKVGYDQCAEVVSRFRDTFGEQARNAKDLRSWLVKWIDAHPLYTFCFLRDWVCTMRDGELEDEQRLMEILFWLVQDCRNAYLSCRCYDCQDDRGVPLARIWLHTKQDKRGLRSCAVLLIDAYPPYRQPLGPLCWPAPQGDINVGQVIWHRPEEACTTLAELGVRCREEPFAVPASLRGLEQALKRDPWISCGDDVVLQTLDVPQLHRRVVGVAVTTAEARQEDIQSTPEALQADTQGIVEAPQKDSQITPAPSIGLSLSSEAPLYEARAGETVQYRFTVANTGEAPLLVSVQDELAGPVATDIRLDPGASQNIRFPHTLPPDASGELSYELRAMATADDGRSTPASMRYTVTITDDTPPDDGSDLRSIPGLSDQHATILEEHGITTHQHLLELEKSPGTLLGMFANRDDVQDVDTKKVTGWLSHVRQSLRKLRGNGS